MRPVVMRHKNISGLLIKLLDRKLTGNQGCIYLHVDMGLTIKEVRTAWSITKQVFIQVRLLPFHTQTLSWLLRISHYQYYDKEHVSQHKFIAVKVKHTLAKCFTWGRILGLPTLWDCACS